MTSAIFGVFLVAVMLSDTILAGEVLAEDSDVKVSQTTYGVQINGVTEGNGSSYTVALPAGEAVLVVIE